jgi:hypothetical protein
MSAMSDNIEHPMLNIELRSFYFIQYWVFDILITSINYAFQKLPLQGVGGLTCSTFALSSALHGS